MESSEEQAILSDTEAFAEAWNRGDAKEAASLFAEDGVRVGAFGDRQKGRAEVEAPTIACCTKRCRAPLSSRKEERFEYSPLATLQDASVSHHNVSPGN